MTMTLTSAAVLGDNNILRSFKASALALQNRDIQTSICNTLQNSLLNLYVANNTLHVEGAETDVEVTIYNMTGLSVWHATFCNGSMQHLQLPAGLYIAVAKTPTAELSQKLILK